MAKIRDNRIDALKGIAIIAIVFYHLGQGILPYGYLGVEIFLVISGFLMMKGILREYNDGQFKALSFIFKRILRLLPCIIAASIVSLALGAFLRLTRVELITVSLAAFSPLACAQFL